MSKKTRTKLSLLDKIKILKEIDDNPNESKTDVAKRLKIPLSTLATIVGKREEIEENFMTAGPSSIKRSRMQDGQFADLEKALFWWFQEKQADQVPISGPMLQEKALDFATQLKITGNFKASIGWLQKFKVRHGITCRTVGGEYSSIDVTSVERWKEGVLPHIIKDYEQRDRITCGTACGESAGVDVTSVEQWKEVVLPNIIKDYDQRDIYNTNETGLFYSLLPSKTLAEKNDPCFGGQKSKLRITVLLTTNADGSDKVRPLIIGKSQNPKCFKGVQTFPTDYDSNTKAWMAREIFEQYLKKLDARMGKEKRKIILLMDRCAAHPPEVCLKNVRVEFFPANCTSHLQPLDLGIIATMKAYYRKHLLKHTISTLESAEKVNKINILTAMQFTAVAWKAVQPITIKKCFRKAGVYKALVDESTEVADDIDAFERPHEWSNIHPGITFEHFVEWDNNLAVCAPQSDQEIVAEVNQTNTEASIDDSDSQSSDDEEPAPPPTFTQTVAAFEIVKRFVYSKDVTEKESDVIIDCEQVLYNM